MDDDEDVLHGVIGERDGNAKAPHVSPHEAKVFFVDGVIRHLRRVDLAVRGRVFVSRPRIVCGQLARGS
jgi:hypothetical protein